MAAPASETSPLPAPPSHTVSILPAATVVIVAVVTLVTFAFLNIFDASTTAPTTLPIIVGGLPEASSTSVFAAFAAPGLVPADVTSALVVPVGAARVAGEVTGGGGVAGYDRAVRITVHSPRPQLLGFYRSHLEGSGWRLFSQGTATGGGDELLFQKAGSDGWYWEVGVVARTSHGATVYTYRLIQASDLS